jgi:hypothetical protein
MTRWSICGGHMRSSSKFAEISMCCWLMWLFRAKKPLQDEDDPWHGGTQEERQAFLDKIVTLQ